MEVKEGCKGEAMTNDWDEERKALQEEEALQIVVDAINEIDGNGTFTYDDAMVFFEDDEKALFTRIVQKAKNGF